MHTDLSPHLHSADCNQVIEALQQCHKDNTFSKFFGACNTFDNAVVKCLKQERLARSAANRAKARERQQLIKQRLQEQQ